MDNTEVITALSGLLQDASELTDIRVAAPMVWDLRALRTRNTL